MCASNDATAPKGLPGWWASPPRSGMRRLIAPWEYRHLRGWAGVRMASGLVLVGLGAVTLSFGGNDRKTYGWTMAFLALAGAQFSFAYWELAITRSAPPRTWPGCARKVLGPWSRSQAGRAVDGLAQQVGVPVVARVLLHEVLPHPPHRGGLLPERERVVQLRALQRGIDRPALGPVALEVLLGAAGSASSKSASGASER